VPSPGTLTDNGVALNAGDSVSVADISANKLVYTPATDAKGTVSFTFQVQDDGGPANGGVDLDQSPNHFAIAVGINLAPAGTNSTVTALEDTGYASRPADFGFNDVNNPPDNLLAVKITTLPTAGTLVDNGNAVHAGDFINVGDINAGKLVFTAAANANGANYASFTFQVQDDGGTANGGTDIDQSPNMITVNVTAVNDAPAGMNHTATAIEDTGYVFTASDFGFTDPVDAASVSGANVLAAVMISALADGGDAHRQRQYGACRRQHQRRRHQFRQADLYPGRQPEWRELRVAHVPGAG